MRGKIVSIVFYITGIILLQFLSPVFAQQAYQNYSNTKVKNDSGKPMDLITITDDKGNKIADLFMTGKEMSFDSEQRPFKGEGYVQALPSKFIHVSIIATCKDKKTGKEQRKQLLLGVNRIQWDEEGKTIDIRGVKPIISTSLGEKLKIVSDLNKPKLKDGALVLDIEGKGEFQFIIKYANIHNWSDGQCKLF